MRRLPSSLSVEALKWVWHDSRDGAPSTAGAPGVDGVSAMAFSSSLADHVANIRSSIRSDTYRFSPLRSARVLKASGGHRIIAIPTVRDRLLQRALLRHLEADPRFVATSEVSYGFTKGRTLADAQRRALFLREQRPWMLQADIIRFFDRIERPLMKALVRRRVSRKLIADLMSAAIDCELETAGEGADGSETAIQPGRGLRQGMPISPVLSNLLLKKFDDALAVRGFSAIRYADDIAIFGESERECLDGLDFVRQNLARLSLDLPDLAVDGKTTLRNPSESAVFLGVEIAPFGKGAYQLRAPTKKLNDIEAAMSNIASLEKCTKQKKNLTQVARSLDSFVVGHAASMMVLEDGGEFRSRIEILKQRQLRRLLEELIGKNAVKKLSDIQLAFLGSGLIARRAR